MPGKTASLRVIGELPDQGRQGRPEAQGILAAEVTRLVHGDAGLQAAQRITEALFSGSPEQLSEDDLEQLRQDGLPCSTVPGGEDGEQSLTAVLSRAMEVPGKQVKDALGRGAVLVNGQAISAGQNLDLSACFPADRAMFGRFFLVRMGKKKYHLFVDDSA